MLEDGLSKAEIFDKIVDCANQIHANEEPQRWQWVHVAEESPGYKFFDALIKRRRKVMRLIWNTKKRGELK